MGWLQWMTKITCLEQAASSFKKCSSILSGMPIGKRVWKRIRLTWGMALSAFKRCWSWALLNESGSPPLKRTSEIEGSRAISSSSSWKSLSEVRNRNADGSNTCSAWRRRWCRRGGLCHGIYVEVWVFCARGRLPSTGSRTNRGDVFSSSVVGRNWRRMGSVHDALEIF